MNTTNEVDTQAANVTPTKSLIRTIAEGVWFLIRDILAAEDARSVTPEGIDSLAADMDRQGQLESALLIRQADGTHKLVFGNRRLAAARKLGWEKLKVDIKENVSESERLQMILSENGEREDVSPFYVAGLYDRIMEAEHLSPEQLPDYLKKDRATVYRYLSLAKVPAEIQAMSHACDIGLRQCLAIARLTRLEDQRKVMEECAKDGLAGKALDNRVKQLQKPAPTKAETAKSEEPKPMFQFTWKKGVLAMKARPFEPESETWEDFLKELDAAYRQYVEAHPQPAANPKPAEAPSAEVTQAA